MNFNVEIKLLSKIREEHLEKEFESIVRRCIEIFKTEKVVRTFVFCKNYSIGVICDFAYDRNKYLIGDNKIPIINNKYFAYFNNEEECFDKFLKDFEYYLYKNTDFDIFEAESNIGKVLCIELPM